MKNRHKEKHKYQFFILNLKRKKGGKVGREEKKSKEGGKGGSERKLRGDVVSLILIKIIMKSK